MVTRLLESIAYHGMVHGDRSKSPTVLAVLLVAGETANPSVQRPPKTLSEANVLYNCDFCGLESFH